MFNFPSIVHGAFFVIGRLGIDVPVTDGGSVRKFTTEVEGLSGDFDWKA